MKKYIYALLDNTSVVLILSGILIVAFFVLKNKYRVGINHLFRNTKAKYLRFLESIFKVSANQKGANFEDYIELVESGDLYRKLFLGVSEDLQGFLYKDPITSPGVICIGTQGSGKTTTASGILTTLQITSSSNIFFLIIDTSDKGAGDYNFLFDDENVATCLYDKRKLVAAITLTREELTKRGEAARKVGSFETYYAIKMKYDTVPVEKSPGSMYEYEDAVREVIVEYNRILDLETRTEKELVYLEWIHNENIFRWEEDRLMPLRNLLITRDNQKLAKEAKYTEEYTGEALFIMVFEEFHSIVTSEEVNFLENCKTPGTLAHKLFDLARTGRSWGIGLFLISQRATYTEMPTDLKAGVKNALIHKLGSANDAQSFNVKTTEIPPILGRIISEDGFIQFPYISGKRRKKLLEKYKKPFTAKLFNKTPTEFRKSLSGNGSDGMVDTFPLGEIIHNAALFNQERIVSRIFSLFDITLPDDLEAGISISRIAIRDGIKYALIIIKPPAKGRRMMSSGGNKSQLKEIKEEMEILKLKHSIVISFDTLTDQMAKFADYSASKEDLLRIAEVVDKKDELTKRGIYEEYFSKLPLVRKVEEEGEKSSPSSTESEFDDDMDFLDRF